MSPASNSPKEAARRERLQRLLDEENAKTVPTDLVRPHHAASRSHRVAHGAATRHAAQSGDNRSAAATQAGLGMPQLRARRPPPSGCARR